MFVLPLNLRRIQYTASAHKTLTKTTTSCSLKYFMMTFYSGSPRAHSILLQCVRSSVFSYVACGQRYKTIGRHWSMVHIFDVQYFSNASDAQHLIKGGHHTIKALKNIVVYTDLEKKKNKNCSDLGVDVEALHYLVGRGWLSFDFCDAAATYCWLPLGEVAKWLTTTRTRLLCVAVRWTEWSELF